MHQDLAPEASADALDREDGQLEHAPQHELENARMISVPHAGPLKHVTCLAMSADRGRGARQLGAKPLGGLMRRERKCEGESGALAVLALDDDPPAVGGDDALGNREPEAGAALLCAAAPVAVEHVR